METERYRFLLSTRVHHTGAGKFRKAGLFCLALMLSVGCLTLTGRPPQLSQRSVAITIDDLPGAVPGTGRLDAVGDLKQLQGINRTILQTLKAHNAPAI